MSATQADLIAAFDIGTSSAKGVLFDAEARVVATARQPLPVFYPQPGWAEQAPGDWWDAVAILARRLREEAKVPAEAVAGISFCAQMAGTVPVDDRGEALGNALIWLDTRSAALARRLIGGFPSFRGYGLVPLLRWLWLTNGAPNRSGKDPATKIPWLREADPERWARTRAVLDVKDYLLSRATGERVTTPDCAHLTWLMDSRVNAWSPQLLDRLGIDADLLPRICPANALVGGLRPAAAADLGLSPGTPVAAGLGDVAAFSLAAGSTTAGVPHVYLGTSAWCAAHMERRAVDPFTAIGTLRAADPDRYLLIATQETAGACLDAVCRWLGLEEGSGDTGAPGLMRMAEASEPGARGLTFLPWLFGERVPMDDPDLRGGLLGLSLAHRREDVARAVVEGVAFNLENAMTPLSRLAHVAPGEPVRLLGGCARSDLFATVLAQVLGRPVLRMAHPELGGAFGAMACARLALGWSRSWAEAAALSQTDRRFDPPETPDARLAGARRDFASAYKAVRGWYKHRALRS
jgi:xylulokinase